MNEQLQQRIGVPQSTEAVANIQTAEEAINKQEAASGDWHRAEGTKPMSIASEAELSGGGSVRKEETMMTDYRSVTNNPNGESEQPSAIETARNQHAGVVNSSTEHTTSSGTEVKYGGRTDYHSWDKKEQDGVATVTRTYEEQGREKQYTHKFKTPGAARLITRLAAKRIEQDNPIPSSDSDENKAA